MKPLQALMVRSAAGASRTTRAALRCQPQTPKSASSPFETALRASSGWGSWSYFAISASLPPSPHGERKEPQGSVASGAVRGANAMEVGDWRERHRRVSNREGAEMRARRRGEIHSAHGEGKPEAPRRSKRFAKQASWRRATVGGRTAPLRDICRAPTKPSW
jgi:hypothetical protein